MGYLYNTYNMHIYICIIHLKGFPGGSVLKDPPANDEMQVPSLDLGRFPRGGNGNPLQYSCLGNPMDRRSPAG